MIDQPRTEAGKEPTPRPSIDADDLVLDIAIELDLAPWETKELTDEDLAPARLLCRTAGLPDVEDHGVIALRRKLERSESQRGNACAWALLYKRVSEGRAEPPGVRDTPRPLSLVLDDRAHEAEADTDPPTLRLSPEARAWANRTMLSLEAGNAQPTPKQWAVLRAKNIDYETFVTCYGRAGERIDAHHDVLTARLCEFTSAEDIARMAARGAMAVVIAQLTAARLDLANARAEQVRAEMANSDATGSPCVTDSDPSAWPSQAEVE